MQIEISRDVVTGIVAILRDNPKSPQHGPTVTIGQIAADGTINWRGKPSETERKAVYREMGRIALRWAQPVI